MRVWIRDGLYNGFSLKGETMYTGKISIVNKQGTPFSLSNEFDDVMEIREAVEDSNSIKELVEAVTRLHKYNQHFEIVRDSPKYTRLSTKDCWGNIHYLIAYKEA